MRCRTMNLIPQAIKDRVECTEARRRIVVVGAVSMALLGGAWLHGGLRLSEAEAKRAIAEKQAEEVLAAEQKATMLSLKLDAFASEINAWRSVQFPFDVSALLATIANELPASITCDNIEFDASSLVGAAVRSTDGSSLVAPPARVRGELAGIAESDVDVALLVEALRNRSPIDHVEVETTRHQQLKNRAVRAFRIRFEIELDHLRNSLAHVATAEDVR
jgi:hypothetical protein